MVEMGYQKVGGGSREIGYGGCGEVVLVPT
jgi:hypothetical protein